jgi:hypothetical protein
MKRTRRGIGVAAVSAAALTLTTGLTGGAAEGSGAASQDEARYAPVRHNVVATGLDNPRQLSRTPGGSLVVGLAGHGGNTSKLAVIKNRHVRLVLRGFPSFAEPDGSFAVGINAASKRPGGKFFALATPHKAPPGQRRDVWLLGKAPGGHVHKVANIGRFERRHNPDREVIETNPYSVLALQHRVLVADAAGDYIAEVRGSKVRVWAVMPEYGPRIDAVPTVVAKGADGFIYVGELHSERKHKAKVWKFSRDGKRLRSWKGFTTVTGVARTADGTLYVSELFGGPCTFDRFPRCIPGRVVKVAPNGKRSYYRVPFPAGIAARGNHVWVSAFSIAPGSGAFGNPAWAGQVWHFRA